MDGLTSAPGPASAPLPRLLGWAKGLGVAAAPSLPASPAAPAWRGDAAALTGAGDLAPTYGPATGWTPPAAPGFDFGALDADVEAAFQRDANRDGYLSGNEIAPELARFAQALPDGRMIVTRQALLAAKRGQTPPVPQPYAPAPQPYAPAPQPYAPAPQPYVPAPAPYAPAPAPYVPAPAPYSPQGPQFGPSPAPYQPSPVPYQPSPAPYTPGPAPYVPAPAPYQPGPSPYGPAPMPTPGPTPGPAPAGDLLAQLEAACGFVKFAPQKSYNGDGILADIERHLPSRYGTTYRDRDPITWGHETSHGIASHLRNIRDFNPEGKKVNGFYVGGDKAIVLEEPPITKSSVGQYVPSSLRNGRYDLYVIQQRAFEREPLYIMDEWVAYTNGAAVGVELAKAGKWTQGGRDGVAGVVDFTAYGFAMAMAIEAQRPGYLAQHPQLKAFIGYQGLRGMDLFRQGLQVPAFAGFEGQHRSYRTLQTGQDAQALRDFIRQQYGDAYLQRLLGQGG